MIKLVEERDLLVKLGGNIKHRISLYAWVWCCF
jgi:hypothetical protein